MLKKLLSKRHHGRTAQAMVEFALTALVFLFLIVMIIEVARIMQAYVTIQHAAREAARYAVTGKVNEKYAVDLLAGWNESRATADPLQSIRPCWPLFADDNYVNARPLTPAGAPHPILYQPYRGPRTCSVEEAAITNMAGLILNPNAATTDPDYYEIIVSGSINDIYPQTGSFTRLKADGVTQETKYYVDYYGDPAYDGDNVDTGSRGYAGDPGKKVVVQIEYRIRLITPLLSNIAPSVRLNAIATMTVETFGGTGLQREAVLPPPDIKPQKTTSEIGPADLKAAITCPVGPFATNDIITCYVEVRNDGDTPTGTGFQLGLYYTKDTQLSPLEAPPTGATWLTNVPVGALQSTEFSPFNIKTLSVGISFTEGGNYYVYAWADSLDEIQEVDTGLYSDPARETNNLAVTANLVRVEASADLDILDPPPAIASESNPLAGTTLTFTVRVKNNGPSMAETVILTLSPGADLDCGSGYNTPCSFSLDNMASGAEKSHTFSINIAPTAADGERISTLSVNSNTHDPNDSNNLELVTITVGGVILDIAKSVAPTAVDYSASTPSNVTYTVTVHNTSSTAASGIRVEDNLDNSLQYVSAAVVPSGTCARAGNLVSCTGISLTANDGSPGGPDTATVTIQAVVPAGTTPRTIPNQATVVSPQSPLKTSPQVDLLVRGVDIEVRKATEGNITSVMAGQQYTYVVRATNNGTLPAQNVTVRDLLNTTYLQPGITAVADIGSYTQSSGDWVIGNLNAGQTATLRLTVTVQSSAPSGASIPNVATLQAGVTPPESNPANNSASFPVTVTGDSADLGLSKALLSSTGAVLPNHTTMTPGTVFAYRLILTNHSTTISVTNRAVEDNNLRDALSGSAPVLELVNVSVTGGTYAAGQWTGISLTPGQSATAVITVRALGREDVDYVLTNTANIVAGTPADTNPGNNSSSRTIQINWPDPVFINAGDPASGCVQTFWGQQDSAASSAKLSKNYTWTVAPNANWELSRNIGRYEQWGLINLNSYQFILRDQPSPPNPTQSHLTVPGQRLFGCVTATRGFNGNFTYTFLNLAPGRWKLYLAFADWQTSEIDQRKLDVSIGSTLLLNDYDIVQAIRSSGLNPNLHSHDTHTDVHYIIEVFDVTVDAQGELAVRFTSALGDGWVNGLGVEYVGQ